MKLEILVPHWKESPEEVQPLLDSIALQQGVDLNEVGVVISYDGEEATPLPEKEWIAYYKFNFTFVHPKKGGVSATRNAALDAATAEYVMFCDADDCFCDVCGMFILFQEMNASPSSAELAALGVSPNDAGIGFDTLVSVFREQTKDKDGNLTFINHDSDSTFVHGKVHRRHWLIDNNIRFNPDLTIHEDSYFNVLCREVAKPHRAKYCPTAFYLWRWRDESVCRHDSKYILKTYNNMIDSNDALVDEFTRRMMHEKANAYCIMMCFDAYYTMNKAEWRSIENQEYRDMVEQRFAEYFKKHKSKWDSVGEHEKAVISNVVRQRSVMEGMLLEAITIDQWLSRISIK